MPTVAERAADLYAQLKPAANAAADNYILAHTPAELQAAMQTLVGTDIVVNGGDAVAVTNFAGAAMPGSPGVAQVAGGTLTAIKLASAPLSVVITNGNNVVVHNAAGAGVAGSPGVAEVAGGALTDVKLTV